MKKIFTLVFVLGTLTAAIAQPRQDRNYQKPGYDNNKNNGYESRNNRDNRRDYDGYKFSTRDKDALVIQISRDYNEKIESVRRKWFMSGHDKRRLISSLEAEKSARISGIYARFDDSRNRNYNGYSYNNHRN